jgi:hypothetical protein
MDPAILSLNLSSLSDHLRLFVCLLFGLPTVSFVGIRFWIARHSAKVQRNTNWFVPTDLESDAARMHYSLQHNSVAFGHLVRPNSRAAVNSSIRRDV